MQKKNPVHSWTNHDSTIVKILLQGIVDGSASKPALRQDTGYMVEKTYLDIAPYLGTI